MCDITDPTAPERHFASGDVVVNCAAYTKVDDGGGRRGGRPRRQRRRGRRTSRTPAPAPGAELVHVSTDYVFNGDFGDGPPRPYEIDDATDPLSVYGRTKLDGEFEVLSAMPGAHVVRTAWIFSGGDGGDFVATMRRLAAGDGPVDVVADQIGSPTYVGDLVEALLQVARRRRSRNRVLHAANAGQASRFEQARAVFELVGADPERVRPVGTDAIPRPAPRPPYSALRRERRRPPG